MKDPVAQRRISVGVYDARAGKVVSAGLFGPGADVVIGSDSAATLVVASWTGPAILLISNGVMLHLGPGMRLDMCDDDGSGRVGGTYQDLIDSGVAFPIEVGVCKLNVKIAPGFSAFVRYLEHGEAPRGVSEA